MSVKIRAKKDFTIARVEKGFTLKGLANAINACESTISLLESGNRGTSPKTAKVICQVLNKNFNDIFEVIEKEAING